MPSHEQNSSNYVSKRKPKNPIKFQVNLNEEQKVAKSIILETPVTILKGAAGSGKAQPLTSTIYTPSGPVTMGSLKVGDIILGTEGKTTVQGIYPQGVEDVYEITCSDGSKVEASLGHLWTVMRKSSSKKRGKWETLTTEDLKKNLEKGIEYRLPNAGILEFEKKDNILDPYLLGILLSEGHIRQEVVTFSTNESTVLDRITRLIKDTETEYVYIDNYDYRFKKKKRDNKPNRIVEECRKLGLAGKTSYDKFIPNEYKFSSVEDRLKLLQGLVDGDGYVDKNGNLYYNTSSKQLVKDVKEVVQTLGGRATSLSYYPKYTYKNIKKTSNHLHYTVSITIENIEQLTTIPFKKQRLINRKHKIKYTDRIIKKIERVREDLTQCIKVEAENSLYITDNCIVTHNTLTAAQAALDLLFTNQVEKIIITRPTVSKEEIGFLPGDIKEKMDPWLAPIYHNLYMLYRKEKIDKELELGNIEIVPFAFLRGRTFVNSFVIVDEAQNVTHSQMETVLGRLGKGSKMAICGDIAQIDLKDKKETGLSFLSRVEEQVEGVRIVHLKENHRHEIVAPILQVYKLFRD